MISLHKKYRLPLRVLGRKEDMGMSAHAATACVDARVDMPVGDLSDRACIRGPAACSNFSRRCH
ncbi:hypothetical protein EFQ99_01415 [Rhizobium vallis]|uniref:Uncharacterized protein n=1 Tax=Rhizobium vallis TaxID=634290 RepID=A0A3S0Y8M9_9HYPH|nr:hypothetical protein EFQ99_01415 [Rhizobium vallis]